MSSIRSVKIPRTKAIAILRETIGKVAAIEFVNKKSREKYDAEIQQWFKKLPKSAMTFDRTHAYTLGNERVMIAFDAKKHPVPTAPVLINNPCAFNGFDKELKLLEMSTSGTVSVAYDSAIYKLL